MTSPSPLRLDLAAAQCLSLEVQFSILLTEPVTRELAILGSHEEDQEEMVYFHEDYKFESQKLHSWGEVHLAESGDSEVMIEYLVESELEDQTEMHHTDFTLAHLFEALEPVKEKVSAAFTVRFDLGHTQTTRFSRLLPHELGINGGHSVEYRGAHMQIKNRAGELFDLWFDLRSDDSVEATLRFNLDEPPTPDLPGRGLAYGRASLAKILSS
ncbi:MAG: hypothetical protein HW397_510 [Dehalococcoidia bacterium]|nr:hypothetical protein [Dehalococcoidia bacterium]